MFGPRSNCRSLVNTLRAMLARPDCRWDTTRNGLHSQFHDTYIEDFGVGEFIVTIHGSRVRLYVWQRWRLKRALRARWYREVERQLRSRR